MADERVKVRKVTDVHMDFDYEGEGQDGQFYFLFVLDDGAAEFVMRPSVSAGRLLMQTITASETLFLDTESGRLGLRGLD